MKAILLAGGRGTRMGALTTDTPKPLISVGGRLLIERAIDKVAESNIEHIIVSTGYLADQFESALGDGQQWDVRIEYATEDSPLGTGGALARVARNYLQSDETVVVMNADLISAHSLKAQLEHHASQQAEVTLHVRHVEDPRRFGVVQFDATTRVCAFIEKPDEIHPSWINAGTYVIQSDILKALPQTVPLSWERDVLPAAIAGGKRVFAYQENDYFRDVGTPADVEAAEVEGR